MEMTTSPGSQAVMVTEHFMYELDIYFERKDVEERQLTLVAERKVSNAPPGLDHFEAIMWTSGWNACLAASARSAI